MLGFEILQDIVLPKRKLRGSTDMTREIGTKNEAWICFDHKKNIINSAQRVVVAVVVVVVVVVVGLKPEDWSAVNGEQ